MYSMAIFFGAIFIFIFGLYAHAWGAVLIAFIVGVVSGAVAINTEEDVFVLLEKIKTKFLNVLSLLH